MNKIKIQKKRYKIFVGLLAVVLVLGLFIIQNNLIVFAKDTEEESEEESGNVWVRAKQRAEKIVKLEEERAENLMENKEEKIAEMKAKKEEKMAEIRKKICDRWQEFFSEMKTDLSEKKSQVKEKKEARLMEWENKNQERDQKLEENRKEKDAAREAYYQKLLSLAKTDEQKQAVEEYQKTLEAAIVKRRSAIDAAINAFREGVRNAVKERQTAVDDLVTDFNSQRAVAIENLKKNCSMDDTNDDTNTEKIYGVLREELNKLRMEFKSKRKEIISVGETVRELAKIKNEAIHQAIETFKEESQIAREQLKNAFSTQELPEI